MVKFKKVLLTLIIVILIFTFAGCATININAKITENNDVTLVYEISVSRENLDDTTIFNIRQVFKDIEEHWASCGYQVEIPRSDDYIILIGTLNEHCESREEAFNKLYELLTDEISPFDSVSCEYNQTFYYEDYLIKGNIDLTDVIDNKIEEEYPDHVTLDIDDFFEESTLYLNFELPNNDSDSSNEITVNALNKEISFTEPTEFSISGLINNNVNVAYEEEVNTNLLIQKKDLIIWISIVSFVLILFIIILILRSKNKKTSETESTETEYDNIA